jgi:hypothetical protein
MLMPSRAVVTALSLAVVTRPRDGGKWEGFDGAATPCLW